MSLRIEMARRGNMLQLEDGLRALARDLGDPYRLDPAALERLVLGERPACCGALAFKEDAVQGVALFSPLVSTALGCAGVYVSDLWVSPEVRGEGVGRALLTFVAKEAFARWQSGFIRLAAYEDHPKSIAFYKRLGFERTDGEVSLRLSGSSFQSLMRTP